MSDTTFNAVDPVDLSDCESAAEAATQAVKTIKEIADSMGQKPDLEVTVDQRGEAWVIFWEGGTHEWAVKMVGGIGVLSREPEIQGIRENDQVNMECKNGSAISFYDI